MLEEYLNIERQIAEEEANNPIQPLELKADQLARLEQEIDTMESTLSQLEEQTWVAFLFYVNVGRTS